MRKEENGDKPATNGSLRLATSKIISFLINIIVLIGFAFFGFWNSAVTNRQNGMEAAVAVMQSTLAGRGERISTLEATAAANASRIGRIEDKLDRLIDRFKP